MKIQQVRFHRKGICAKGWPVAHIGHRVEPFPGYTQLGDVYAIGRQQLLIGRQVDGGNRERPTDAASTGRRGINEETMSQQRTRSAQLAPGK